MKASPKTQAVFLLHGLSFMPVYLSLLCWRPDVIRPPSVRVSAERLSSSDQQDGSSRDLQLKRSFSADKQTIILTQCFDSALILQACVNVA